MKIRLRDALRVVEAYRSASSAAEKQVRMAFFVAHDAPLPAVESLREEFVPRREGGLLHVAGYGGRFGDPVLNAASDAAVLLAGGDAAAAARLARASLALGTPTALLVASADKDATTRALAAEGASGVDVIAHNGADAARVLAEWLVEKLPSLADALAANYACCRDALADDLIRTAGSDNAKLAAKSLRSGSSASRGMGVNEAALGLHMAAVDGRKPGVAGFAATAAGIAAASAGARALVRLVLRRTPVPGAVAKPVVAMLSTMALGAAMAASGSRGQGAQRPVEEAMEEEVL